MKTYYSNGKIKTLSYSDTKGNLQVEFIQYFESGQVSTLTNFEDNVMTGELKSYYENGKLESIAQTSNNLLNGSYVKYDEVGNISEKILFKNSKPILRTLFYSNGKTKMSASYGGNNLKKYNSVVFFDKRGKIILSNSDGSEKSEFVSVKYSKNNLFLKVKVVGSKCNDSIVVKYKKRFIDEAFLRKIVVNNPKAMNFEVSIKPSDYYKGRLNILIETYSFDISPNEGLRLEPIRKNIFVQLDKGEKPAKYNIDPIL